VPGMDIVSVAELEKAQEALRLAQETQLTYQTAENAFDLRVMAQAVALQEAIELEQRDVKVVDLVTTIRRSWGRRDNGYVYEHSEWPKLAVANVIFVGEYVRLWSFRNGVVRFGRPGLRNRRRTIELPAGTDPKPSTTRTVSWAETLCPQIPPQYRPLVKPEHLILWEVEEWSSKPKERPPRPPCEPAILEKIGGSDWLYKVVCEWDLTDLEVRCMVPI
jgi:hypothetical protein